MRQIKLICVDANDPTNTPINDCNVTLGFKPGRFDGGHKHAEIARPNYFSLLDGNGNAISAGTPIDISSSGTIINYTSPEASGEVEMTYKLSYSKGVTTPTNSTYFDVLADESYESLATIDDLYFVNLKGQPEPETHPGDGYYGTTSTLDTIEDIIDQYKTQADKLFKITNPTSLNSQGASLSLGGVFDINHTWKDPHCGHRDGKTIDLSFSNLTRQEITSLRRALSKVPAVKNVITHSDHYHVQMR